MHIHAAIEDEDLRIDLMNQVGYFLPHLLALSTSSPFWRGAGHRPQGLSGRTIANDLPRSGTPERFWSWRDWQLLVEMLAGHRPVRGRDPDLVGHPPLGQAPDAGAADHRHLHRARRRADDRRASTSPCCAISGDCGTRNQSWRRYRRILIEENKWRAQRWGVEAELADFAAGRLKPMRELVEELIDLLREDAAELRLPARAGARPRRSWRAAPAPTGSSRSTAGASKAAAAPRRSARAVVDWLIEATLTRHSGLG